MKKIVSWLKKNSGMFFCLYFVHIYSWDSDGTITIEEQIVLVLRAKVQCELNITAQLQEGGKDAEETVSPMCPTQNPHKDCKSPPLLSIRELLTLVIPCLCVERCVAE